MGSKDNILAVIIQLFGSKEDKWLIVGVKKKESN
jgi:hypothetical protein